MTDPLPLYERTFTVPDNPCPECRNLSVIGFLYVNEAGEHMHTHYVCTFWPTGKQLDGSWKQTHPCGWHGWRVPTYRKRKPK